MKKFTVICISIFFIACHEKEVLLPQASMSLINEIQDHSPIYIFFKITGTDTIADVNRKNSISSTNWIFNIDRRLTLEKVIPEISKLQIKKETSAHTKKGAINVFSYADTLHKKLAFLDFTAIKFKEEKNKQKKLLYVSKNGSLVYKNQKISMEELNNRIENVPVLEANKLQIYFDKKMTFGTFLPILIQWNQLKFSEKNIEIFIQ